MTDAESYVTQEGDSVDLIAFNRFGVHGMEVAILESNRGLADRGPILPAGLTLVIPLPEVKDRVVSARLWD